MTVPVSADDSRLVIRKFHAARAEKNRKRRGVWSKAALKELEYRRGERLLA
jgi:hypothetical protein